PLPVPSPGGVMSVGLVDPLSDRLQASYRDYVDIRDRSQSFSGLAAYTNAVAGFAAGPDSLPTLRAGLSVSDNFFRVLAIEPQLGRTFRPDEGEAPGRDAVVILGHDFWEQQLGGDRAILGRIVRLNGIEFTVVGVAPPGFPGLDLFRRNDFYVPLMMWP